MLSLVEFHIIENKSNPYVFFRALRAHANLNTHFIALEDGCSIKIKNKFLIVTFKPRIYL